MLRHGGGVGGVGWGCFLARAPRLRCCTKTFVLVLYLISQPPGRRSSSYLKSESADSYFRVRALLSAASTMRMACVLRVRRTTDGCLHAATVTLIQFFVFAVSYSNRLVAISHNAVRPTRRELRKASIIKHVAVSSSVLRIPWDFPAS